MVTMKSLRTGVLGLLAIAALAWGGTACAEHRQQLAPSKRGEIFYHVFVRSFRDANGDHIGDLDGITQGLGYIQRLGVTTVLLTPVQPSPFYHNYFASDFTGIAPENGGKRAWFRFLRAAHARGIRVYMDLEFQYVAGGHPWLASAWHHPKSPYREWLMWNKAAGAVAADPLASPFGLYAGAADGSRHAIALVNLDHPAVRAYFRTYLLRWADPHGDGSGRDGVDGYRIDHMMDDLDNEHVITHLFGGFWKPLIHAVKARRPGLRFVGEQWDWGYGTDFLTRGTADMVFAFPLREALIKLDKAAILKEMAATEAATPAGKSQIIFLENHDTDRFMSAIGNDPAKARAGAAMLLMLRGEPSIYYGQELGMRGQKGPMDKTDAPDIPRREAFRWRADLEAPGSAIWYRGLDRVWQPRTNRAHDGVSVEEETRDPASLLTWYRHLIALRRGRPELDHGDQAFPCADASPVLCLLRSEGARRTLLMVNLSPLPAAPDFTTGFTAAGLHLLGGRGEASDVLAPYAVRIVGTP